METSPLAHRFEVQEVLDQEPGLMLGRARDLVSGDEGWLLRLAGEGRHHTLNAVRLRLQLFASRSLARRWQLRVHLAHEQESFVFLQAPDGARPLGDSSPELDSALGEGLRDWKQAGVGANGLSASRLWCDDEGPFLLPTAYCLPGDESKSACFEWREPTRCAQQVNALLVELRERGFEIATIEPGEESAPALGAEFAASLESALDRGACFCIDGDLEVSALADALRAWSESHGRSFVDLRPFVGPRLSTRRKGNASSVILMSGSPDYAAFAESLYRLERAGWLDGTEILVLVGVEEEFDEPLRLFRLSAPATHDWKAMAALPGPRAEVSTPGGGRLTRQVLSAVTAADRPVSVGVLAKALSLEESTLLPKLVDLFDGGHVGLGFGLAEELGRAPALMVVPRGEVDASGEAPPEGMHAMLAATWLTLPRRPQWGCTWIRIVASRSADPDNVGSQLRELAERAAKDGQALMEYACFDKLLEWEDITRPRLEDRVRAAIRRAHEHRVRGELDRTDRILATALEELQSHVEVAPARLAPLICDLVLERAHFSLYRSRFSEAEEQLRATLDRYRDHLPAVQRTRIYLDLSWALLQMGRTRESMDPCNLSLRLVDSLRHPQLVARAHNQLGYAQYKESDYETSVRSFQRALVLRQQAGDDLAVARTYNNLSLSQRALGQMHEAENSLRESMRLKRIAGDHRGAAASLLNLGFVQLDQRNFDEAQRCGRECLQLGEELGHPETEAEAYGLLGEVAAGRDRLEDACRYLQRDLEICEATGHEAERLATLRRLVDVLLRLDRQEEAAQRLEGARELLIRQPSRLEAAMLDRLEGELFLRSEAFDPAGDAFGSAARGFAALRRHADQVHCLARRAQAEYSLERHEVARQSLRELRELALSHELASLPEEVRELEAHLGPAVAPPTDSAPSVLLHRVADLVREGRSQEVADLRRWLSATAGALGADQVLWLAQDPGDVPRIEASAVATRGLAPPLRDLVHDALAVGRVSERSGNWWAIAAPRSHWLCVRRERELDDGELDFATVLAAAMLPGGAPTESREAEAVLPERDSPSTGAGRIVGHSPAIARVQAMIDTVSAADVTVLLLGENGTGKDLVARAIHERSVREPHPFVALNCASIPPSLLESELFGHEKGAFTSAHERRPGVFERAERGTIFLDEIGEMPLAMQAKMLRVLQERQFTRVGGTDLLHADVRVIAATNRKLLDDVREGRFRMDLYYRLNVVSIDIPPLRERVEDIEPLVEYFVHRHARALGSEARRVSREALARLREHPWPGNVRELENVIKNALVFTRDPVIRSENLPEAVLERELLDSGQSVEQAVHAMVLSKDWSEDRPLLPRVELLLAHEAVAHLGNKTLAAKMLGITKPTLYSRLRRFEALYGEADEGRG